jgi:hypothetical protein
VAAIGEAAARSADCGIATVSMEDIVRATPALDGSATLTLSEKRSFITLSM